MRSLPREDAARIDGAVYKAADAIKIALGDGMEAARHHLNRRIDGHSFVHGHLARGSFSSVVLPNLDHFGLFQA